MTDALKPAFSVDVYGASSANFEHMATMRYMADLLDLLIAAVDACSWPVCEEIDASVCGEVHWGHDGNVALHVNVVAPSGGGVFLGLLLA